MRGSREPSRPPSPSRGGAAEAPREGVALAAMLFAVSRPPGVPGWAEPAGSGGAAGFTGPAGSPGPARPTGL
ncbi:hypothetical protein ACFYYR_02040 [Streptomyces sp. NPDC001922]|uniref:hypothetical protein n=1 Tax=Streptomyces sp. NPDC001922 TaxID=3364624 RepID=UPI0036977126